MATVSRIRHGRAQNRNPESHESKGLSLFSVPETAVLRQADAMMEVFRISMMIRKVLRIAGGLLLVLIGIAGILLPIMPGWVFLIPGLVILSEYFPPVKRLLDWAKAKATGKSGVTGGVDRVNDTPGNG